jgi:hypothetical protein
VICSTSVRTEEACLLTVLSMPVNRQTVKRLDMAGVEDGAVREL